VIALVLAGGVWLASRPSGGSPEPSASSGESPDAAAGAARLLSLSITGGSAPYLAVIGAAAGSLPAATMPIPPELTIVVPGQGETTAADVAALPGPSVQVALSKLGSPYRTGAKGPSAFDCSGFVYWCLNQAGVRQGYMTSKTWRSVTKYQKITDIDDCKKGDVLVFKMSSTRGHVGIVIDGTYMVDASSGQGEVVRREYKTAYWRDVFYCAYRIF
jgi:cell wall-associated NlpC family hydrolase